MIYLLIALGGAIGSLLRYVVGRVVQGMSASGDRKSTRLNSSHLVISYAAFCLKKKRQHGDRGDVPFAPGTPFGPGAHVDPPDPAVMPGPAHQPVLILTGACAAVGAPHAYLVQR